jgi:hypothetical protein
MKPRFERRDIDEYLEEQDKFEHARLAKHEIRGSDLCIVMAWIAFAGTLLGLLVWSATGTP